MDLLATGFWLFKPLQALLSESDQTEKGLEIICFAYLYFSDPWDFQHILSKTSLVISRTILVL